MSIQSEDATAAPPSTAAPLLSIGVAVYNGAAHLRESLDSLLAQDVGDLELVISDNASTDRTPEICAEYAARDTRVRYSRNSENIGAARNFDRAFELSSGRYFMWGSDDDIWDPRFASACISQLDRAPNAVMCTSRLSFIDERGTALPSEWYRPLDTRGMGVEARAHQVIARFGWFGLYSVIRPDVLRRTRLYRPSFGGDVQLLMELALLGESLVVPETLLRYRFPTIVKTASEYASEIRGTADVDETTRYAQAGLAAALYRVVCERVTDAQTVRRIHRDFVETLSGENADFGRAILAEYAGVRDVGDPPAAFVRLAVEAALRESGTSTRRSIPGPIWQMHPGMRLGRLRGLALRILRPFLERQHQVDAQQTAALTLLTEEVERLRALVDESANDRTDRPPQGHARSER